MYHDSFYNRIHIVACPTCFICDEKDNDTDFFRCEGCEETFCPKHEGNDKAIFCLACELDGIINISNDKIGIIELIPDERRIFHQYLETKYSLVGKVSLKSKAFEPNKYAQFMKCYHCDYKSVRLSRYHYGVLPNNMDEWKSGICPKCLNSIMYEPNYDDRDNVRLITGNNIIAYGKYLSNYNSPKYAKYGTVTNEEIYDILKNKTIYEIDTPTEPTNKKNLQQYIDNEIAKIR